MKVIKRDGSLAEFNTEKIKNAIIKAMKNGSGRVDKNLAENISLDIFALYLANETRVVDIKKIEKDVHRELCLNKHEDTARAYEAYRAVREYQRKENTTDNSVEGLVNGLNKETLNENSNKRGELISTQAQLIYEEVSKDMALRKYYPPHIADAHKLGLIHVHDLGHTLTKNPNCCLANIYDMLQNGTVINGKMIEKPKSFRTACTISTQIISQIASNQHGGVTISLQHLSPFVRISELKIRKEVQEEWKDIEVENKEDIIEKIVEKRLDKEIKDGIQTFNYQINTLQTSAGQSPFLSLFMHIDEFPEYEKESVKLIKEVVKQRLQGIKNEVGVYDTYEFPKLLYVLDENNIYEGSKYYELTKEVAKCTAKRLVPDFLSAKKLKENYDGLIFPPMG